MKTPCGVCGQNNWQPLYQNLQVCKNCGMVKAADKFFKEDAFKIYTEDYFKDSDYADYQAERGALEKNFVNRLLKIRKIKAHGKLLEVGSAYGYFLNLAKKYYDTTGVDLDPKVCKLAQQFSGVKVTSGDLVKKHLPSSSFDIICMFDVIEHLQNPVLYIKECYRLLKPNGIIVIETGDIGSVLAKMQKSNWRLIKPPFHLQYFNVKTLKQILGKNGFKVLQLNRVPFYRSLRQTFFSLTKNFTLLKFINKMPEINFAVNTFDLIFVIAKK